MRTPLLTALTAAALALTACGTEDTDAPDDDAPQGAETRSEEDDADGAGTDGDGSSAEDVSQLSFTECRSERFTIAYPQSWETNEDDEHPACRVFHPDEIELPERPRDLDLHWAAAVYVDDVPWQDAQPDEEVAEILSSEQTEVDGRRASVHELRSHDEGLIPEGERRYVYTVDLDGETLIAATHTVGDTDYERDRTVLDRMMDEVSIHAPTAREEADDGDDPEEVAAHEGGEREFRVTTRSIADGVCLSVQAGGERDEACGPVDGALDVRVLTVGDEQYVAGIVGEGVTEIDMIANDGSAIADEHATAELVEVLGESGYRAFAPARAPATYQAVVGYGADGEEAARHEL